MKKFVILPLVAVATLGLAACDKSAPVDNTANVSEITLNSEDTLDVNAADPAALNVTDNATVVDNATALDSAGNVTAK
ncbi:MAG: hypothetical protein P0Y59_01500 [Candidatus Sphingomonas phytovorans]|nr:hypothetical protein [Sphingomonas sp.]WEK00400.1 MAG: hypothetical protein P0Y59_01500 [Sphingomonas sp.]